MIVFERVTSFHIVQNICRRWIFVAMFLLLFIISAHTHPVYAADAECTDELMGGLRTECQPYIDAATGDIIPGAEYYKCADAIECNDPNNRCCVNPEIGSYGGNCKDPGEVDRINLGSDGEGGVADIINFKPSKCNVNEDEDSPSGKDVFVVPFIPPPPGAPAGTPNDEQSLYDYVKTNGAPPSLGVSQAGYTIYEETIPVLIKPFGETPRIKGTTWLYTIDTDGTRRYFVRDRNVLTEGGLLRYYIDRDGVQIPDDDDDIDLGKHPLDPRTAVTGTLSNIGCKIGNVFLTPLYKGLSGLNRRITDQNNLPDITLLCNNGVPHFLEPDTLTFDASGAMTGLDPTECYCVDSNTGPGTAAVLLCTRFIAGIEDGISGAAQWRAILPASANGTGRFGGLLFGETHDNTTNIDDFRKQVKDDIDGFFNSNDEIRAWADKLVDISSNVYIPEIFMMRFLGRHIPANSPPLSNYELDNFKQRPFVRQYISCLSCAKYGGFPSALGCMPMNKVERFLGEGVLGVGITFAGALSILCIIYGAIQFQLSGGESAKVQKAQKLITQCIIGLLIILFSVFLLRFVGVNLLRIYGLG